MNINLQIENVPIEKIKRSTRNARTHTKKQIKQIAQSIDTFGFNVPLLIDEETVLIAGDARLSAAQLLELKIVPTICITHLGEAEKRAFILAHNKLALEAGWDEDLLRDELEFLTSIDLTFDVDLTGFSTTEVDLILESDSIPDTDDEIAPTPEPEDVVSQRGDIWWLRHHCIIAGDSRNPETIDSLMDGAQAQMVLSDPPYDVPIAGHVSGLGKNQHREFPMASGEMTSEEFTQFLTDAMNQFARVSVDGSLHYLFMDWRHMAEILAAGKSVYDRFVNCCIWNKGVGGMGSLYRSQYEMVFLFKHGTTASHINNVELGKNGRYRTNVWDYPGVNSFGPGRDEALALHPTVKPVQLLAAAILDVTHRGDIILDGFLGSGSTLIAAERTGRICYGVELDPGYVDVTVRRWESISGERATLAGTDMNIDQVAIERGISREVTS